MRWRPFHPIVVDTMEMELLLFGSSSVPVSSLSLEMELLSSVPVRSKLKLVPELGAFSSVLQHHWLCPHLKIDCMHLKVTRSVGVLRRKDGSGSFLLWWEHLRDLNSFMVGCKWERNFEPIYNVPTRQENRLKETWVPKQPLQFYIKHLWLIWVEELDRKKNAENCRATEIPN